MCLYVPVPTLTNNIIHYEIKASSSSAIFFNEPNLPTAHEATWSNISIYAQPIYNVHIVITRDQH